MQDAFSNKFAMEVYYLKLAIHVDPLPPSVGEYQRIDSLCIEERVAESTDRGEWRKIHVMPTPLSMGQGQDEGDSLCMCLVLPTLGVARLASRIKANTNV